MHFADKPSGPYPGGTAWSERHPGHHSAPLGAQAPGPEHVGELVGYQRMCLVGAGEDILRGVGRETGLAPERSFEGEFTEKWHSPPSLSRKPASAGSPAARAPFQAAAPLQAAEQRDPGSRETLTTTSLRRSGPDLGDTLLALTLRPPLFSPLPCLLPCFAQETLSSEAGGRWGGERGVGGGATRRFTQGHRFCTTSCVMLGPSPHFSVPRLPPLYSGILIIFA